MTHRSIRCIVFVSAVSVLLAACGQGSPPAAAATAPAATPGTATPLPPTSTPEATPTATLLPSPTSTPVPQVSVSENTNCRSGPNASYVVLGALQVGQMAEVKGRAEEPGYLYVTGAGLPEAGCWLWGEYAQVEGEVESLPVFTPAPSPTPDVGFDVYLKSFERCGDKLYAVFAVKNVGGKRFWSAHILVEDFATHGILHQRKERHPFAETVLPVCPPGHGNGLFPGETRYVHAPLSHAKTGHTAVANITLCTADYQGGTCVTEYSYFNLP